MALSISHAKRERINLKNSVQHIITRCNNKELLINDNVDFARYLQILETCKDKHEFLIHDYVIMNNHVHLVIKLLENEDVSAIMHSVNRWYARWYNERYERKGHFWEDRFYAELIKDDLQLLAVMRYIELNPVRASLCKNPSEWNYSGAQHYLTGNKNDLLTTPDVYTNLGATDSQRQNTFSNIFPIRLT